MSKRNLQTLQDQICEMAERLSEDEEHLTAAQLGEELRRSGINPDRLKQNVYQAAREIATRERARGQPASQYLQQAIDQFAPDDVIPRDEKMAIFKMKHWLDNLSAPFSLPTQFQAARAYRKSNNVSNDEQADLDTLEQQLKDEIQQQDDTES